MVSLTRHLILLATGTSEHFLFAWCLFLLSSCLKNTWGSWGSAHGSLSKTKIASWVRQNCSMTWAAVGWEESDWSVPTSNVSAFFWKICKGKLQGIPKMFSFDFRKPKRQTNLGPQLKKTPPQKSKSPEGSTDAKEIFPSSEGFTKAEPRYLQPGAPRVGEVSCGVWVVLVCCFVVCWVFFSFGNLVFLGFGWIALGLFWFAWFGSTVTTCSVRFGFLLGLGFESMFLLFLFWGLGCSGFGGVMFAWLWILDDLGMFCFSSWGLAVDIRRPLNPCAVEAPRNRRDQKTEEFSVQGAVRCWVNESMFWKDVKGRPPRTNKTLNASFVD